MAVSGETEVIKQANQLCGLDLDQFKAALAEGAPITVTCTQEAPLFEEVAEDFPQIPLTFVNIRETAGWSPVMRPWLFVSPATPTTVIHGGVPSAPCHLMR